MSSIAVIANTTTSSNSTYRYPFTDESTAVSAAIIFFFMAFGLVGNSLTITLILKYKELHSNVFMRFILSLCVSDLISALISWLFLYRRTWGFDRWSPIPDVLCTIYWAIDMTTLYVTASHILSFATLRLISIRFPLKFSKLKKLTGKIWICSIWLICIVSGFLPSCFIFGVGHPQRNSNSPNSRWPSCTALANRMHAYRTFQLTTFVIFLCLPVVGVTIMCSVVIYLVRKRAKMKLGSEDTKFLRKQKQAELQLVLIIAAFVLGHVPFLAYEFWSIQKFPDDYYYYQVDYWFGMTEYFFLRFSECLNPIFYNLGSAKMRKYLKRFVNGHLLCCYKFAKPIKMSTSESGI